jgi:hypothetical protein
MAIVDKFTVEKPNYNQRCVCTSLFCYNNADKYAQTERKVAYGIHPFLKIRYKLRKPKNTQKFSRVYVIQCIFCRNTSRHVSQYKIPNINSVPILDNGPDFHERDNDIHLWALKNVPFKSKKKRYEKYLKSKAWRDKRDQVLERDDLLCQVCCINNAEHVHHLTYNNVYNEPLEDLISVCIQCHRRLHSKDGDNKK